MRCAWRERDGNELAVGGERDGAFALAIVAAAIVAAALALLAGAQYGALGRRMAEHLAALAECLHGSTLATAGLRRMTALVAGRAYGFARSGGGGVHHGDCACGTVFGTLFDPLTPVLAKVFQNMDRHFGIVIDPIKRFALDGTRCEYIVKMI